MKGTVEKIIQWNPDTKTILIRPERRVTFIPGQFMMVSLIVNGKLESRAFSLCNTPNEELLEITFRIIPQGKLSPQLFNLKEGDEMIITGPYGNFRLDFNDKNAVLIAGGTGIAPLMSMIRYNKYHGWPIKMILFYSARKPANFLYMDEIKGYAMDNKLTFIPISQDPNEVPEGFITGRIKKEMISSYVDLNSHFYLCGSPLMIKEIELELKDMGVEKASVRTDKW